MGFDFPGQPLVSFSISKAIYYLAMQFSPLLVFAPDTYMADFMRSSLADVLSYIWTLILAFFVGQTTSARSELPPDAGASRTQAQQTLRSYMFEKEHSEKERYLRHPSIHSKRKGRQKDTYTESRSKRHRSPSIFLSNSSMQYLNSFIHRPPAGSAAIPVVIITPSTPTGGAFPVTELLSPSLSSPLQLADAMVEPPPLHLPISAAQPVDQDTEELSLSLEEQASIPLDVENDISDVEFDSWSVSAGPDSLGGEPSFFLPESLQKITFEPIRRASHALSAVSDMLYDVQAWRGVEALGVGMSSYFTSTPPKRRRSAETELQDIENNYVETIAPLGSPSYDGFFPHTDLVPYPDVFDLDMYCDATPPLSETLEKPYNRDCTSRNILSPKNDGLIDHPPCERLPSDVSKKRSRIPTSNSFPVTHHEREHDLKLCRDNIHQYPSTRFILENTSAPLPSSSILPQSQRQHRISRHKSSKPRYIVPLNESTNTFFRPSTTANAMTSPSLTLYSFQKSTPTRVKSRREPFRSAPISTHSRRSSDSESESDVGSMDALNARLREACDSFSIPTFREDIEIWEPISF